MDQSIIPERIRRWRKATGMSQEAVAAALGVSRTQVVSWERGTKRIPLLRLLEIADLYSLDVGELLSDPDDVAFQREIKGATHVSNEELRSVIRAYLDARKKGTS